MIRLEWNNFERSFQLQLLLLLASKEIIHGCIHLGIFEIADNLLIIIVHSIKLLNFAIRVVSRIMTLPNCSYFFIYSIHIICIYRILEKFKSISKQFKSN